MGLWLMHFQRTDMARLVKKDESVKLLRETGPRVMRLQLGIGPVNHPNEPLQARPHEGGAELLVALALAEVEDEVRQTGPVHQVLVAAAQGGGDAHDLHVGVPAVGGGDGAGVGAAADEPGGGVAVGLLAELADVELVAGAAHAGGAGVADVAVVGPDDGFGAGAAVLEEAGEGLEHVGVAEVPGFVAAVVHGFVVFFGVCWRVSRRKGKEEKKQTKLKMKKKGKKKG